MTTGDLLGPAPDGDAAAPATGELSGVGRRVRAVGISEGGLAIVIGLLIVFCLDTEQLTVIPLLKDITATFSLSPAQSAWVLSATGIAAAASVPVLSRLADLFGMRRMLLLTTLMVVAGNVVCVFAQTPAALLTGRVIVGFNAALPIYYAILRGRSRSGRESDKYSGAMTFVIGLAISGSYLMGGAVISLGGGVRTVFWLITVLSLVLFAFVWLFVEDIPVRTRVPLDYVGALLLAAGLTLLVYSIGEANDWGWGSGRLISLLVLSVLLLVAWAVWELRHRRPLFDLRVIKRRDVWPPLVIAGVVAILGINGALAISNYVQTPSVAGYGLDATVLMAGIYLLPCGLTIAFGGGAVGFVIERFGQRVTSIAGASVALIAFLWFSQVSGTSYQFFILSFLIGVSYALSYTASTAAYLRAARPGEQGMLTGAARGANTAIGALGPPIITALLTAAHVPGTPLPARENYDRVWLFLAAVAFVMLLVGLLVREARFDQRPADNTEWLDGGARSRH
ncbi:MFS transporter [Actinoallomurus iriomotensis]|uniref:MFS transporter n=1 Tax=Actinoallomurus iriomotensis TaxID=478107 RepID=A0A9W6W1M0_9ACTN|nr:MFS transporter [Actinoallomurus iriomotensis]GLY86091.1 MFS transporter [Actinoallomurus iriomotensis]